MLGKQRTVGGTDTLLDDGVMSPVIAGVVGFKDYPTIIEYSMLRNSKQRVGTLHITPISSQLVFSDDYVETDDIGITLTPILNNNTIELQYTSTIERYKTVLKLASRTLVGDTAPTRMPDSVPGAPTNVSVAIIY